MADWMEEARRELERQRQESERQRLEQEQKQAKILVQQRLEEEQRLAQYELELRPLYLQLGATSLLSDVKSTLGWSTATITENGPVTHFWGSSFLHPDFMAEIHAVLQLSKSSSISQSTPYGTSYSSDTSSMWLTIGIGQTADELQGTVVRKNVAFFNVTWMSSRYHDPSDRFVWMEEVTLYTIQSSLARLRAAVYSEMLKQQGH